jgi:predicted nucleotidyltransferase
MKETLFEKFVEILAALGETGVEYCLVGGFAVVLHGGNRLTNDLDVFITTSESNLTKLRKALSAVFHDESINEITSKELASYPVIRYGSVEDFNIDLIASLGESFSFADLVIEEIILNGQKIKIASPESLYKMKEKTYRAVDQADLVFLKKIIEERKADAGKEV